MNDYRKGGGMKVTLAKHGGFAAGIHLPPKAVDTSTMKQADVDELMRLVSAAKSAPVAKEDNPGRARDAVSYTITVEENGKPTLLRQSDVNMSQDFGALLNWLERQAGEK
jgi:hypothetical protein